MAEVNLLRTTPKAKRNLDQRAAATEEEKIIACKYGKDYFDGSRNHGYGGYRYDGRWIAVAETICEHWNLKAGDKVLDIGCAKGFLVKDLMTVCPGLDVYGIDISEYALQNCAPEVVGRLHLGCCTKLPFPDNSFKACLAINVIHNLDRTDCIQSLKEMQRLAPNNFVQVDAYRTKEEREVFIRWVLTAKTHDYTDGWLKLFNEAGYTGDYYWTIIE